MRIKTAAMRLLFLLVRASQCTFDCQISVIKKQNGLLGAYAVISFVVELYLGSVYSYKRMIRLLLILLRSSKVLRSDVVKPILNTLTLPVSLLTSQFLEAFNVILLPPGH